MRAFIAIELPANIKNDLTKIQDKLKISLPKINWVKPANLHLSLKFLGEISSSQLEPIVQIITEIIKTTPPFEIDLETLGVFPNYRAARVIWIGTDQPPIPLKQLAEQLETNLFAIGLPKEEHPFRTHITLGRVKNPLIPEDLKKGMEKVKNDRADKNFGFKFKIEGITLFQSLLSPGGPIYSIIKKADF
jgi:RNA 2',3'-cyclic 3'-phosphodiesterase